MGFKTMNRFPGEDLSDDVLLPPTYFMGESNWMLLERRDFLAEFAASRASRLLPCTELEFPPRMKPPVEPVRLLEREAVMGSAVIGPDADMEDIAGMTSQIKLIPHGKKPSH